MALRNKITNYAHTNGDILPKDARYKVAVTGDKQYQVMKLGELTLYEALSNNISLHEKITITRRILWECCKLHTGKLSRSHRSYIHCDIKPENILLNPKNNTVFLIDYGISVSADTISTLFGTTWYTPVINGTTQLNQNASNFDRNYARRVAGLQTGFDIFSLKRTIYTPGCTYESRRCIFNNDEWLNLPNSLTRDIAIGEDRASTDAAINIIRTKHETALDLAMRFIAMEAVNLSKPLHRQNLLYNTNIRALTSNSVTTERQEMVCECAEMLDYIQANDPAQIMCTLQDIINAAANENHSALPNLTIILLNNACLLLTTTINQTLCAQCYEQINAIINMTDVSINKKITHLYELFQKIQKTAQAFNKNEALNLLLSKEKETILSSDTINTSATSTAAHQGSANTDNNLSTPPSKKVKKCSHDIQDDDADNIAHALKRPR